MTLTPTDTAALARAVLAEVERAVVGKRRPLELVLLGVLAGGHVLLEDVPGVGKTLMAKSFADVLGLSFTRVQFTPDLLPADLTGASVWDPGTAALEFRPGPVFTNLLLADEINRTPPKTQAALLEAMGERQVSADGQTLPLPDPFVVIATDNPVEFDGTYPLPEAQLDRFALRVRVGYLAHDGEVDMVRARLARGTERVDLAQVTDAEQVRAMRRSLEAVEVARDVVDYAVRLVAATREHPHARLGSSPRGALALTQVARGRAVLAGRDFVTPDDIADVAVAVLGHRVVVRPDLWLRRITGDDVVADVLAQVPTPATLPDPVARR